jgi:hypothetical protein
MQCSAVQCSAYTVLDVQEILLPLWHNRPVQQNEPLGLRCLGLCDLFLLANIGVCRIISTYNIKTCQPS